MYGRTERKIQSVFQRALDRLKSGLFLTLVCIGAMLLAADQALGNYDIYRNNPLPSAMASSSEYLPNGALYTYNQDMYPQGGAVAHSGTAVGNQNTANPQYYQHVYAYTVGGVDTQYLVQNKTGNSYVPYLLGAAGSGRTRRTAVVEGSLDLDGSVLLASTPSQGNSYTGLLAKFDVLVTLERENRKDKKLLAGSISLVGKKNGKVAAKTTGKIKKRQLSVVEGIDGVFRVDFSDLVLPYKTRVRYSDICTISTEITSTTQNQGNGTGAEVLFAPGDPSLSMPVLPSLAAVEVIPEPATFLFLLAGSVGLVRTTRRTRRIGTPGSSGD